MEEKFKKIIDISLKSYEGPKTQIIIKDGNQYLKGDQEFANNVFNLLKNQKNLEDKVYIKDIENNDFEVNILSFVDKKDEYIYEIALKKIEGKKLQKPKRHMKNKFKKEVYNANKVYKNIKYLGIVKAQQVHAKDETVEKYIKLRDFLKSNVQEFPKKKLYIRTLQGEIIELRHKNLFSQYKDEISDFEKKTYIEKEENKLIQISYNLDEKILEYDQNKIGLLERKNSRFFAKEIYNKKGVFSSKELTEFLKNQDVYVKIENVLLAQNKLIWEKIKVDDMNIRTLEKEFKKTYKNKKERIKNIQTRYLSKRDKKRKKRRIQKKFIKEGLIEYKN